MPKDAVFRQYGLTEKDFAMDGARTWKCHLHHAAARLIEQEIRFIKFKKSG
jgi:hypothetical protein